MVNALFGRRRGTIDRVASAARSVSRTAGHRDDVATARIALDEVLGQRAALEAELAAELETVASEPDPAVEMISLAPVKGDTAVTQLALLWR